jgi:hypothetical protein
VFNSTFQKKGRGASKFTISFFILSLFLPLIFNDCFHVYLSYTSTPSVQLCMIPIIPTPAHKSYYIHLIYSHPLISFSVFYLAVFFFFFFEFIRPKCIFFLVLHISVIGVGAGFERNIWKLYIGLRIVLGWE